MTLGKLIEKVNEEKPNAFKTEKLVSFVNDIEVEVAEQLKVVEIPVYTTDDMDEDLLAPAPYSRLYESYLKAMIDYANEEYPSYENNQVQHVQDFRDFVDWVVRTDQVQGDPTFPRRMRNIF